MHFNKNHISTGLTIVKKSDTTTIIEGMIQRYWVVSQTGKMAQWVKCWLEKHAYLSLDSENLCERSWLYWCVLIIPVLWKWREFSGLEPASLAEPTRWDILSQKIRRAVKKDTRHQPQASTSICTYIHAYATTHSCVYTCAHTQIPTKRGISIDLKITKT